VSYVGALDWESFQEKFKAEQEKLLAQKEELLEKTEAERKRLLEQKEKVLGKEEVARVDTEAAMPAVRVKGIGTTGIVIGVGIAAVAAFLYMKGRK